MSLPVVVVGGGMVGSATACAFAQAGEKVIIVEAYPQKQTQQQPLFDNRVSALTRSSQRFLEGLGVWKYILEQRLQPYFDMHVWDESGSGFVHFDSADIGEPDLGHIIENRVIVNALHQRLEEMPNVSWRCPAKAGDFVIKNDTMEIQVDDEIIACALIVAADGATSPLREKSGIVLTQTPYNHIALVATIESVKSHQQTAWQRFLSTGPLAILPLNDQYSSIVWSATPEESERLMALSDSEFEQALELAIEGQIGAVKLISQRQVFPLVSRHAREYVKPSFALVGDAAHTIHPLAGQGVNLGFMDAAGLSQVCLQAVASGKPMGSYAVLRKYERWRKGQNQVMQLAMKGLKELFMNDTSFVKKLRSTGLNLFNRMTPLKNKVIRQAMGLEGDLPSSAK